VQSDVLVAETIPSFAPGIVVHAEGYRDASGCKRRPLGTRQWNRRLSPHPDWYCSTFECLKRTAWRPWMRIVARSPRTKGNVTGGGGGGVCTQTFVARAVARGHADFSMKGSPQGRDR